MQSNHLIVNSLSTKLLLEAQGFIHKLSSRYLIMLFVGRQSFFRFFPLFFFGGAGGGERGWEKGDLLIGMFSNSLLTTK